MKPAAKVRSDIELIEALVVAVGVGEQCAPLAACPGVEELLVVVPMPGHVYFGHQLIGARAHRLESGGAHQARPGGVGDGDPQSAGDTAHLRVEVLLKVAVVDEDHVGAVALFPGCAQVGAQSAQAASMLSISLALTAHVAAATAARGCEQLVAECADSSMDARLRGG
jgi:hypothetical protein